MVAICLLPVSLCKFSVTFRELHFRSKGSLNSGLWKPQFLPWSQQGWCAQDWNRVGGRILKRAGRPQGPGSIQLWAPACWRAMQNGWFLSFHELTPARVIRTWPCQSASMQLIFIHSDLWLPQYMSLFLNIYRFTKQILKWQAENPDLFSGLCILPTGFIESLHVC